MNYSAASGWILKNIFYQNNRCILCWIASIFRGICEIRGKEKCDSKSVHKRKLYKKTTIV